MKITRSQKLGQSIHESINNKVGVWDLRFHMICKMRDFKQFKKDMIWLGYEW